MMEKRSTLKHCMWKFNRQGGLSKEYEDMAARNRVGVGGCFFWDGTFTFWIGPPCRPPSPLNPPYGTPTRTKRVPICSFFK